MRSSDLLFYVVISYILIAGGWWYCLLQSKNQEAFEAKKELVLLELQQKGIVDLAQIEKEPEYRFILQKNRRQKTMILGEGIALLLLAILGIWKIYQIFKRRFALAQQQQNFLLSITHELKSPIASIQLVLETLQKRQLSPAQLQTLTRNGLVDTYRLHQLVQDLLLAARVEGGHKYSYESVNLCDLLHDAVELLQPKFSGELKLELPTEDCILAKVDTDTLYSAILNLIENAIKYSPENSPIEISLQDRSNSISLEIRDLGIGIPKTERSKVFDKFYRVGNEQTRKTKGTGLGLYIVKKVVEAHQGSIHIKDNSPQGTIFQLVLPKTAN